MNNLLDLTARELQVLELIVEGFTDDEIASRLYVTKDTINTHRKKIKHKLQVTNVAAMVAKAFRLGLIKSLALLVTGYSSL